MKIGRPVERHRFIDQFSPLLETDRADRGDMDQPADLGAEAGLYNGPYSIPVDPQQPVKIAPPVGDEAGQMDDVGLSLRGFKNSLFVGDVPIDDPDLFFFPALRYAVPGE